MCRLKEQFILNIMVIENIRKFYYSMLRFGKVQFSSPSQLVLNLLLLLLSFKPMYVYVNALTFKR